MLTLQEHTQLKDLLLGHVCLGLKIRNFVHEVGESAQNHVGCEITGTRSVLLQAERQKVGQEPE
jgi:hypothetical protein